jgi:hypothetical protein
MSVTGESGRGSPARDGSRDRHRREAVRGEPSRWGAEKPEAERRTHSMVSSGRDEGFWTASDDGCNRVR